jgi:two-component system NarL family sensor kinase
LKSVKIIMCLFSLVLFSNKTKAAYAKNIDSLNLVLKKHKVEDTNKVNILIEIAWYYIKQSNHPSAINHTKTALYISNRLKHQRGIYRSAHTLGVCYKEMGKYDLSLQYHKKALAIRIKLKNKRGMADSYNLIGDIYNNQGVYKEALKYFLLSLETYTELKEIGGMAWANSNIGVVLSNQNDLDGAIEHYKLAIQQADNKSSMAWFNNNLGNSYLTKREYKKALECFKQALQAQTEDKSDGRSLAFTYNSLGMTHFKLGQFSEALLNFQKSLDLRREIHDFNGVSWSLNDIGTVYTQQKKYAKAIDCYNEALKVAIELGSLERIRNCYESLSAVYFLSNDFKKAYQNHLMFTNVKDSMLNETMHEQIREMKTKYESDKKDAALVMLSREKKLTALENEKNKIELKNHVMQRNFFIAGLISLVALAFFIFNRFKASQKQKKIIEKQKEVVEIAHQQLEEKQKEVMDSIRYAKRIQQALLPSKKYIERILNKPKK